MYFITDKASGLTRIHESIQIDEVGIFTNRVFVNMARDGVSFRDHKHYTYQIFGKKIYRSEKMTRTSYPKCHARVIWLRPKLDEMTDMDGTFFICHKCSWIAQVGAGRVKDSKEI